MNTTTFVNSRYWDLIALTLIGITAPMVIDHYHHVLFGYVVSDSKGILEYVTVISLFCILILVLSPAYYFIIRTVRRILRRNTADGISGSHVVFPTTRLDAPAHTPNNSYVKMGYSINNLIVNIFPVGALADKVIDAPMYDGVNEVIPIEANEVMNENNLDNFLTVDKPAVMPIRQTKEEFTRLYVSPRYSNYPTQVSQVI